MILFLRKYKFTNKFGPIIISLAFVIGVTLPLYYVQRSYQSTENNLLQRETRFASFELAENIKQSILKKINILQILAEGRAEIFGKNKANFDQISKIIVQNVPTFFAIGWVNSKGVIPWLYPFEPNKAAIGKNVIDRVEEKQYLIDSRDKREPQVGHIISLFQGPKGVILYVPSFYKNKFNGWLVGVIDIQATFDSFFERRNLNTLHASMKWKGHEDYIYNYGEPSSKVAEMEFESQVLNQTVIVQVNLQRGPLLETKNDRLNRIFLLLYTSIILIGIFLYSIIKSQLKMTDLYSVLKRDRTLINILSHDMATPLTIISENIKRLKQKLTGQNFAEIDRIIRSSDRQRDLLLSVRSFHATNMRKKRMELIPVLCRDLIHETLGLYEEHFIAKNIKYELILPPEYLYCLSDRMTAAHNVLGNVLSNAIKFSNTGTTVTIRIFKENDFIVIEVADQGIGIPKDILEHFFDETSIQSTLGTDGEMGTGLGMLQIKAFMEFYNGKVKIQTSEKGTTVQLFFRSTNI